MDHESEQIPDESMGHGVPQERSLLEDYNVTHFRWNQPFDIGFTELCSTK